MLLLMIRFSLLQDIEQTAADWSGRYVKIFLDQDKIKSYVLEKHSEIDRFIQRFQARRLLFHMLYHADHLITDSLQQKFAQMAVELYKQSRRR